MTRPETIAMSRTSRRTFLEQSLLLASAAAAAPMTSAFARSRPPSRKSGKDLIRVGVVGVRGRGRDHIRWFRDLPASEVVAICDPDEGIIGPAQSAVPNAKYYRDIRMMLEDRSIDAISIATPNHWHSLGALWGLQAGKHVFVEKPLSHNVFEGAQVVAAASKYGKVIQHGTQSRTQPATRDAMAWQHAGGLGEVKLAYGLCYKRRKSIGKVDGPQKPPETCDYDLWTGPAEMQPLMRKNLHYDWHWVFNTGSGDIGNQGVHQMDIARWGLGLDTHPKRIVSCGGRLGYVDDGNTPNTQIALLDYGDRQVIFEVRGLETGAFRGASVGVVFMGEKGYLVSGSYGKLKAFDHDGKEIAVFEGSANHYENFLDAILADDPAKVNAPIRDGHLSAAMGNLANISYMLGKEAPLTQVEAPFPGSDAANGSFEGFCKHLAANGVEAKSCSIRRGPELTFDSATEKFTGAHAEEANPLLTRKYRGAFVVSERV